MIVKIELSSFKLNPNVDRIKVLKVFNGLNRFIYKGKDLRKFNNPIIPISDIKKGLLQYEINSSLINMKEILSKHIEDGWSLYKIEGEYAIFNKKGFPNNKVYIGDTDLNKIVFSTYIKGSFLFKGNNTITYLLKGKSYFKENNHKVINTTIKVNDVINIKLSDYFPDAKYFKIVSSDLPYYSPSSIIDVLSSEDVLTYRFNPYTDEVYRIINNSKDKNYKFVTIQNNYIYFETPGGRLFKTSLPKRRNYIHFVYSKDGYTYSPKTSKIELEKVWDNIDESKLIQNYTTPKKIRKSLLVDRNNEIIIPTIVTNKTIEVYE